ncbi:spexin prohormone 2-like [Menidia menidia]
MKTKTPVVWACSLLLSLFVESCHPQKLNVHWGPQSMMYLKGKYGKRNVLEDSRSILRQALQSFHSLLRGLQRVQMLGLRRPGNSGGLGRVLDLYLQQR